MGSDLKASCRESDNIVIYRSPLNEIPRGIVLLALYVATIYVSWTYPESIQYVSLGELFGRELSMGLPLFGIVPLVFMGAISHSLLNFRYVLTPDYVMEIEGLLDLREKSVRLHYIHIRGMEIDRSVLQKLLNIGDLRLGSAVAHGDSEIVMKGIYNPRHYKDIINQRIMAQSGTHAT